MKTIIKIFAAILAAVPVLASCYSEPLPEVIPEVIPEDEGNGSEQEAGTRIITLSFNTKATRTELGEDYTPKFSDGDMIAVAKVTDQSDIQRCEVSVNPTTGIATTVTKFDGELKAVYPASCALINDNDELTYMVPYTQTGKFADANICTATIPDGEHPTAVFTNRTAMFRIKAPENLGDKYIFKVAVKALNYIDESAEGEGQRSEELGSSYIQYDEEGFWNRFNVNDSDDDGYYYISVLAEEAIEEYDDDGDIIKTVVAEDAIEADEGNETVITPKVLLRDLCFEITLSDGSGYMGGFSPKFLKSKNLDPETATVQAGAMYTGVEDHLHKFNVPPIYAGKGYVYAWSEDDLETESGGFFMWGELNGHTFVPAKDEDEDEDEDEKPAYWTDLTGGFIEENYKVSFIHEYSEGEILRLEDDPAYQHWGGAWHMPTFTLFQDLALSSNTTTDSFSCYSYVTGTEMTETNISYYWTSEISSEGKSIAYPYYFAVNGDLTTDSQYTEHYKVPSYYGMRIKAIADYFD